MAAIEVRRRLWSVDEYDRMVEAGVLSSDERVELIEGEIVEMSPVDGPHAACVDRFNELLVPAVARRAIVRVQGPVRLPPRSEPEPDLALLARAADHYASGHPGAGETLLAIEVADSSLAYDRQIKLPLYARSGIREAWLVDLASGTVEVHREPTPDGYAEVNEHRPGQTVAPSALPDVLVDVAWVLGALQD